MMGLKKSVMLSDETVSYLKKRTRNDADISWSQQINGAMTRLSSLYKALVPDLSEDQWRIILDAYSGVIDEPFCTPLRISSDIMDHYGVIDINTLPDDIQTTVKKVHSLSQPEQVAVMDIVNQFWCKDMSETESISHAIRLIVAD